MLLCRQRWGWQLAGMAWHGIACLSLLTCVTVKIDGSSLAFAACVFFLLAIQRNFSTVIVAGDEKMVGGTKTKTERVMSREPLDGGLRIKVRRRWNTETQLIHAPTSYSLVWHHSPYCQERLNNRLSHSQVTTLLLQYKYLATRNKILEVIIYCTTRTTKCTSKYFVLVLRLVLY